MAPEKTNSYNAFLLSKRDNYANDLVRVGSKLLKTGKFNRDAFSKNFILDKDDIIKKIEESVKYGTYTQQKIAAAAANNGNKKEDPKTCVDSQLIDMLRPHIETYAKELRDLRKSEDCCETSNESMATIIECDSSGEKNPNNKTTKADNKTDSDADDDDDNSHYVTQDLMPGECSKIFVQKSRVDIIRSRMHDIDFENDLLETLYVFRR
jgi:hypothetical protein